MFVDTRKIAPPSLAVPGSTPAKQAPALDLMYLIEITWNWRRCIALAVAAGMIAGLSFGFLAKHRYTASAQVLIDPNDLRVVDNVLRGQNQLTETHVTQVENQVRVLISNNVARRVVERLALDRDPEFVGPSAFDIRAALRSLFGNTTGGRDDPVLDAQTALKKRMSAKRVDRTYVVDASVWAHDPQKAVQLTNALLESFIEEQSVARGDAARRASSSLNARLAELRERVQQAEERVEAYKKANGIIATSGTLVSERQVTELNTQLVLARTKSAEAKSRYDKIRELQRSRADASAMGEVVGSPTITALRTQLAEVLRREGEINATLGKRHPAVIEIESQVRRIRRLIDEEVARMGEAARNDMERAAAAEATLAANLERLKDALENTNEASVRLRELERDVQANRSVYEAFLLRMREVSEQERLDTTNIRVIAPPELPENRSFPPRNLVLLIGGAMLGGLLGVALAMLGEWRARRQPAIPEPVGILLPAAMTSPGPVTSQPERYAPPTAKSHAAVATQPASPPVAPQAPPLAATEGTTELAPSAPIMPWPRAALHSMPSAQHQPVAPDRDRTAGVLASDPAKTTTRLRPKQGFRL